MAAAMRRRRAGGRPDTPAAGGRAGQGIETMHLRALLSLR